MWGIYAFCESVDEAAAYTEIAAVPDQTTKAIGNYLYIPKTNKLCAAIALTGATVPGIPYLDSPSLRRITVHYIHPIINYTQGSDITKSIISLDCPITLAEGEGLKLMSNANPAAAEYHSGIVWLSDSPIQKVAGEFFNLYFTAAITTVAGAWSSGNITLAQDLPVGNYAIVGLTVACAAGIAARLIFNTQSPRPGVLVGGSIEYEFQPIFKNGNAGVWGQFHSSTPPQLEILTSAVVTSQVGMIQLLKV